MDLTILATLCEASPEDIPKMIELERRQATASHWGGAEYLQIFVVGGRSRLALVLEEAGRLLGFIVAAGVDPEWEIENIVVAEDVRRRGLGSRLMRGFLKAVAKRGAESVFLEVRESNHAARELYEKWGFVEAGRRRGYYSGPVEDAVICRIDELPREPSDE